MMKMPETASSAIAARIRDTAAKLFGGSPTSGNLNHSLQPGAVKPPALAVVACARLVMVAKIHRRSVAVLRRWRSRTRVLDGCPSCDHGDQLLTRSFRARQPPGYCHGWPASGSTVTGRE